MNDSLDHASGAGGDRTKLFLRLLTTHQRSIYLYIRSLCANPADVDEIQQQTAMVMWEKFDQFTEGTNFKAWAFRIARFEVFNHRSRQKKGGVRFSDALIEGLAREAESQSRWAEQRASALHECMDRLSSADRTLIQKRFGAGASGRAVAQQLGRSVRWVYKAVSRIRKQLIACVDRKMSQKEVAGT